MEGVKGVVPGRMWHAVDGSGRDPLTAASPKLPGAPSPAAALAGAPVVTWPLHVVAQDGCRLGFADALGPGGASVERLLGRLGRRPTPTAATEMAVRATATPAGPVELPLAVVPLGEGVECSASVDPAWLNDVERRRSAPRGALLDAGRGLDLEAALHVAMLLATEALDPADDADVHAHVASGAQLWLLGGAVVWALLDTGDNPFGPWAELVVAGLWPIGPSGGRLVVSEATAR